MKNFEEIFENYISNCFFDRDLRKFYFHFYKKLYPLDNYENYYDFVDWFNEVADKNFINGILEKYDELNLEHEKKELEKWLEIRSTIKIKYPTKKSMTVPIPLFSPHYEG